MSRCSKQTLISFGFVILFLSALGMIWLFSDYASPFRDHIRYALLGRLVNEKALPPGKTVDVIYVLGGNQTSLDYTLDSLSKADEENSEYWTTRSRP